jgi:hypothetical protein
MSELLKKVERIFLTEKSLRGKDGTFVPFKDILYLTSKRGDVVAMLAGKKPVELSGSINVWKKLLNGLFIQTHRQYLVPLDRIEGTFERFPEEPEEEETPDKASPQSREELRAKDDECEISLRGTAKRIPVTAVYGKKLKKALGITRFHYLAPEHPADRALRLYGLIDFGWRELYNLDTSDQAAVAAFREKWDIKKFSKKRMLSYFRYFGANEINTKRVIKNILYQTWRWIQKGIEDKSDGNIRSMWYKIKSVLATHSNILGSGDVDTFYNTLQEMVEERELFRYKDFGFMDMNEPYRGIGATRPEIILASEKLGHYLFIRGLAREYGTSFICLKGEPAVISMEYFADDLTAALIKTGGMRPLTVFCVSDIDPAGYSIERNLVKGLERGHKVEKVVKLVDLSIFKTEDIGVLRFPVVSYEKKGDQVKPLAPATMGQVTKGRSWFDEEIKDKRLLTEKDKGGGWKVFTIHGIESDAADRDIIEARFKAGLGIPAKKKRKKK